MCRGAAIDGKSMGTIWAAPDPAKKLLCNAFHRSSHANPLTAYERMCDLCVSRVTETHICSYCRAMNPRPARQACYPILMTS
jgi:hypothetical protein